MDEDVVADDVVVVVVEGTSWPLASVLRVVSFSAKKGGPSVEVGGVPVSLVLCVAFGLRWCWTVGVLPAAVPASAPASAPAAPAADVVVAAAALPSAVASPVTASIEFGMDFR